MSENIKPDDTVRVIPNRAPPVTRSMLLNRYGEGIDGIVQEVNGDSIIVLIDSEKWALPPKAVSESRRL